MEQKSWLDRQEQIRRDGVSCAEFEALYREGQPAWMTGDVQPELVRIEAEGWIRGRVLDVGCGSGHGAVFLSGKGYDVVGLDGSRRALELAKALSDSEGVSWVMGDALDLGAELGRFDTVLDMAVFHGFSDSQRETYRDSLTRVLKPGGRLVLVCFSELETREGGPRRVSREEIRATFASAWEEQSMVEARYHATIFPDGGRAWRAVFQFPESAVVEKD